MHRFGIKIVGASGGGILSTGDIIIKAFKDLGFYVVAEREYPSVIKGGQACFNINISDKPIRALREKMDVMLAIDLSSLLVYFDCLKEGGVLVHGNERSVGVKSVLEKAVARKIKTVNAPARTLSLENGGNVLMVNMVLIGMLWKVLGLEYKHIEVQVQERFKNKPKILELDLKCLKAGHDGVEKAIGGDGGGKGSSDDSNDDGGGVAALKIPKKVPETIIMDGNKALALGAVHAGCRAYFAYPMSPASTILTHMANFAKKTGMLVKQVEDEISVASMALGAMHMGTRALCATSGGGYDLMTETVSLSGMIECPLVIIVAQRPGPATGLPTWTCQSDLNLAVYSSHGEFPRAVIAVSDPTDCFDLIQHAFNIAEKFQSPVIVLTEKNIAETNWTIPMFEQGKIPIERGLVSDPAKLAELVSADRYRITENGLSKRWLPGSSDAYYYANSDEHAEDGSVMEAAEPSRKMIEKRMKKAALIEEALPEPEIYGEALTSAGRAGGADISFVGWGGSKNVMLDIIEIMAEKGVKVNFLHYSYVFPLKIEAAEKFFKNNKRVFLIEGNYEGQFGKLLEAKLCEQGVAGVKFAGKFLKYNGRPFFIEDLEEFINNNLK